ncbi:hypothetical protein L1987_33547 [Smallanthus sonchifolius]|uniref:Uncharacterized protein n=1 Tax=Smallanthus sonchifolius TaxID=185202 RepID=A0ACB9HS12_9ASTR|nr:hypothetical protein L1987_33547 [Smallanthus sonchifolius]
MLPEDLCLPKFKLVTFFPGGITTNKTPPLTSIIPFLRLRQRHQIPNRSAKTPPQATPERIFVCVRDRNLIPNISLFQGCVG